MKFKLMLRFLVLASLLNVTYETKPFFLTVSLFVSQVGPYLMGPLVAASSLLAIKFGNELWHVRKKVDKLRKQEQAHFEQTTESLENATSRLNTLQQQGSIHHSETMSKFAELQQRVDDIRKDLSGRFDEAVDHQDERMRTLGDRVQQLRTALIGGHAAAAARDQRAQREALERHTRMMDAHATLQVGQVELQKGINVLKDTAQQGVRLGDKDRSLLVNLIHRLSAPECPRLTPSPTAGAGGLLSKVQQRRRLGFGTPSVYSSLNSVMQNLNYCYSPDRTAIAAAPMQGS